MHHSTTRALILALALIIAPALTATAQIIQPLCLNFDRYPTQTLGGSGHFYGYGPEALAVDTDGDRIVVGSPTLDYAVVFRWSGGTWEREGSLRPPSDLEDRRGIRFGAAVAVDGDRIAIGAPGYQHDAGAAFVYEFRNGRWGPHARPTLQPVAHGTQAGAQVGYAVALRGDWVVAGAPTYVEANGSRPLTTGAAFLFVPYAQSPTGWRGTGLLRYPPSRKDLDGSRFGHAIAITRDFIAVGAPGMRGGQGTVETYNGRTANWQHELRPSGLQPGDAYGSALDAGVLDPSRSVLVVGAPGNVGTAYRFEATPSGQYSAPGTARAPSPRRGCDPADYGAGYGQSVAADGEALYVGAPASASGRGHVFGRSFGFGVSRWLAVYRNRVWYKKDELFGSSIAAADGVLVVAVPQFRNYPMSGSVSVFDKRQGGATLLVGPNEQERAAAKGETFPQSPGSLAAPGAFALAPTYPNPFNPATTLRYSLAEAGPVRLDVYDALGRHVRTLVDDVRPAGAHVVSFDAVALPSGAYLARLTAGGSVATQRLFLVK